MAEIKQLLKANNAVLVAHYYTDDAIQQLAEETGGCVADSLEMPASVPVTMPPRWWLQACALWAKRPRSFPQKACVDAYARSDLLLDIGCPIDEFSAFCDAHPDRTVVVYANTSAAVKARADWVVTSSIAVEVIEAPAGEG